MSDIKLAIDIGGTFIDVVTFDFAAGRLRALKSPTTPHDPAEGVVAAIGRLGVPARNLFEFIHGTTLGLNAILERKGTTVGIITNAGFEDLFEIARGSLEFADMYRFDYEQGRPLVERRHIRGVAGRMDFQGKEIAPLDGDAVIKAGRQLFESGQCGAIAVSFLHSYANDAHERRAVALLEEAFPGIEVSAGALLASEYREYERTSTSVLDAYIKPVLKNYLGRVSDGMGEVGFSGDKLVMNSSGGALTFALAEAQPISTVLSGPAGGVSGALHLARATGRKNVLSMDVGGTSLDACLIVDNDPVDVFEARIDTFPVLQPIFDLRTLGAGGGSIASVQGRLLRVGPESAGAVPGPACYGRGGTDATVTDAALVLGYIDTGNFMGGQMHVAGELAAEALKRNIGDPMGITVEEAARAIFDVLISRTASSIKEMMLERGLDPRDFALLAFGGCGPLIGPMLQKELDMPELVVPPLPSVFSAWGMMASDLSFSNTVSILQTVSDDAIGRMRLRAAELERDSLNELAEKIGRPVDPQIGFFARLRFIGQEHTLSVLWAAADTAEGLFARFSQAHANRFGHTFDSEAEIVSLMIKLVVVTDKPHVAAQVEREVPARAPEPHRMFDTAGGTMVDCGKIDRVRLDPGQSRPGPLLVYDEGSSLPVPGDLKLTIDPFGMISLTPVEV